jgi:hypothetical protein
MRFPTWIVLAAVLPASACGVVPELILSQTAIQGSGVPAEETRTVPEFTALDVGSTIEATVQPGSGYSLKLRGDDNLLPLVVSEVRDARLTVRLKNNTSIHTKLGLKVTVTAPKITSARASGDSSITTTAAGAERFEARASGVSRIIIEGLAAQDLELEGSGASQVSASGTTRALKVNLSGASQVHAGKLAATTAEVDLSGASSGTIRATESVQGDLSGASSLHILGMPARETVALSGASHVDHPSEP